MNTIVTTSLGMSPDLVVQAQQLAGELQVPYIERKKQSIKKLTAQAHYVLVVYRDKLVLEQAGCPPFFFHPDTAMLRLKAGRDPLLELVGDNPQRVLDTTMGLASDSLLLASVGHTVTALESQPLIWLIVSRGLQRYQSGHPQLDAAMRSIRTIYTDSLTYLRQQANQSVDIVYADPMFSDVITESENLDSLKPLANFSSISDEWLAEAKRVAKKQIILKAHFRDTVFEDFGFARQVRPNQKFHYGVMNLQK